MANKIKQLIRFHFPLTEILNKSIIHKIFKIQSDDSVTHNIFKIHSDDPSFILTILKYIIAGKNSSDYTNLFLPNTLQKWQNDVLVNQRQK